MAAAAAVLGWHLRGYRRSWWATITVSFLNPIFFLLSIGVLLGGLVDKGNANLGGLSYLQFVAPGLLAGMAMQIGSNESTYPVMGGIRWLRTFHAVIATPVRVSELVAGNFMWIALRILVALSIFTAVAGVAGAFESPLAALLPLAGLLCGLAFAAPISAFAAGLENDAFIAALNRFVIVPMFLFSGTFFPVDRMPSALKPVAWATPLWHGVSLCRDLATGRIPAGATAVHVAYLLVLAVGGAAAAVVVHRRKLLT